MGSEYGSERRVRGMSTITLVVISDGRGELLVRTTRALQEHLIGNVDYSLLIDDSGSPEYAAWLDSLYPSFQIVHHEYRRGFAGAVISAWDNLPVCDYVLTCEDDMVLREDVRLSDMVEILDANPSLSQVVLKRQAWNEHEIAAGGIVEMHPSDYHDVHTHGIAWTQHYRYYSTNVNLMPYRITRLGWPNVEHSEGHFGARLKEYGYSFGMLHHKFHVPVVEHIGLQRVGVYY